jgi:hypothetical protein
MKIKTINLNNGNEIAYSSKKKACLDLEINYEKLNKHINSKEPYNNVLILLL